MEQKIRVLVIAEAANPEWPSVPLIGWSMAAALRDVADIHVVTQIRNQPAFERAGWVQGVDFTAINSEPLAHPLYKLAKTLRLGWTGRTAIAALVYPYFEELVWKQFRSRIQAGHYDIVHRVTPLTPTANSLLSKRCARAGVPFVIGPLNGGVPWPRAFDRERRREQEWLSYVRGVYKLVPGRSAMLRTVSAILVGSAYTASDIPARFRRKCIYMPENGIDPARFNITARQPGTLPLRACFIGRMVPYKGPDILLEAAAPLLRDERMSLDMIGDGPMMADLKALVQKLGIADAVTFHGWLDHKDVQTIACKSQILPFPSVREFGGGVVLEAMALGVVPIVLDYAGPGELVVSGTGIKVPLGTRTETISNFRAALETIAAAPEVLPGIATTAQARTLTHFTWSAKARYVLQVYDWVLGARADKPDLPFDSALNPHRTRPVDDAEYVCSDNQARYEAGRSTSNPTHAYSGPSEPGQQ